MESLRIKIAGVELNRLEAAQNRSRRRKKADLAREFLPKIRLLTSAATLFRDHWDRLQRFNDPGTEKKWNFFSEMYMMEL
jgi:hypothetical protein